MLTVSNQSVTCGPMNGATVRFHRALQATLVSAHGALVRAASIGPGTKQADRFRAFGEGSIIRFPQVALMNEGHIEIGSHTMIGQNITLSAGTVPNQEGMPDCVVKIGNRCLIGQGSGVVGHLSIEIGDDVMTGQLVYITDQNHGFEDVALPIRAQWGSNREVRIGSGSWIGHGSVILPGASIGRNVVIGANSVVTGTIPDYSVAVGVPAKVIRTFGAHH
jgi:acetyltransferase-like isoleucine patch superfamily enzyme